MPSQTAKSSTAGSGPVNVPPNAVRVWRGYRLSSVGTPDFFTKLGTLFIPITVQLQRLFGLTAYLPCVLPAVKPKEVPDEIALVFYRTQDAYTRATSYIGGRAYSLLHSAVFDLGRSQSGFPTFLKIKGDMQPGAACHLFHDEVDWQSGHTQVFVGSRRSTQSVSAFVDKVEEFCNAQQMRRPTGLTGAIVAVGADYVLYWEHWTERTAAQASRMGDLAEIATPTLAQPYLYTPVSTEIGIPSPGLSVSGGECFNTQFSRIPYAS